MRGREACSCTSVGDTQLVEHLEGPRYGFTVVDVVGTGHGIEAPDEALRHLRLPVVPTRLVEELLVGIGERAFEVAEAHICRRELVSDLVEAGLVRIEATAKIDVADEVDSSAEHLSPLRVMRSTQRA